MSAIPTTYGDVNFRSRLEARWAAFFDLLGWSWDYEPIDLDGYIPDFIIDFKEPLLVEVKPALTQAELAVAAPKITESGWTGDIMLVGASLYVSPAEGSGCNAPHEGRCLGLGEVSQGCGWGPAGVSACCSGVYNTVLLFTCYRCGEHDEGPTLRSCLDVQRLWRQAGNAVQWNPPKRRRA